MHTTGIIVRECADEFAVPEHLTRKVTDVRLYAPSLRFVKLKSPDYFFLTTDTPGLMRHLSDEAIKAGATIVYTIRRMNPASSRASVSMSITAPFPAGF